MDDDLFEQMQAELHEEIAEITRRMRAEQLRTAPVLLEPEGRVWVITAIGDQP